MVENPLSVIAQRIGDVGEEIRKTIAVEIGGQHDGIALLDEIPQKQPVVRIRDVLLDAPAPALHAVLEVRGQQRDDAIHVLPMLHVSVHRVLAAHLELGALKKPRVQSGVDAVLHGLSRLHGHPAELAGLVDHAQELAVGIGHLNARGIHLRVDEPLVRSDGESLAILGVR